MQIEQGLSAEEAFFEIGHPFEPTCDVIVEDRLAKLLLEHVAKTKGEGFAAKVRIAFHPGGSSEMKKAMAIFMQRQPRPIFIFDGDEGTEAKDPNTLTLAEASDASKLDKIILDQGGVGIEFQQDSNMTAEAKAGLRIEYLRYFKDQVFYLPFDTPEAGVWDEELCRNLLKYVLAHHEVEAAMNKIEAQTDFKMKFAMLTELLGEGAMRPEGVHAMFVTRFIKTAGHRFGSVLSLVEAVVAASEA